MRNKNSLIIRYAISTARFNHLTSNARNWARGIFRIALWGLLLVLSSFPAIGQEPLAAAYDETLHPYEAGADSTAIAEKVDSKTLDGKILCGYQGWFNAPSDGADLGWVHWNKGSQTIQDGHVSFDLWPDMSELSPEERFATNFKFANGETATLFSSHLKPTVQRHFRWMQTYGIDGVFVQRFATNLNHDKALRHNNVVLDHCRSGAINHGRTYAVMYDLSGLRAGGTAVIKSDWQRLKSQMKITEDENYLHHDGKPVVAIWGIGFSDNRRYSLEECDSLVDFFKDESTAGSCTLMLGIPTYWRELREDAVENSALHAILQKADILSPWTVGRYGSPQEADRYADSMLTKDLNWCQGKSLTLMPVVFPGFSWHNLQNNAASNQIPRLKGQFLWSQIKNAKRLKAPAVYLAMFDEVDEGTAIFKCSNELPLAEKSKFIDYEGLPSDFYLRLTGKATKWFRNEIELDSIDLPPQ